MKIVSPFTFYVLRFPFYVSRLALFSALALLLTAWSYAPQGAAVTVSGQVTNGTPGGDVPAGLPVTLEVIAGDSATAVYTTTLSADGVFRFDGLPLAAGDSVAARVVYQDVPYTSAPVTLAAGQGEVALPITIYETTEDPATVEITQVHVFMVGAGDVFQVGEYYLIGNRGERTYVGALDAPSGRRTTLRFTVPAQAGELSFDGPGLGERFVELADGFADTEPIPPGAATVEVLFRYTLPYQEGLLIERTFGAPVASAVLLVVDAEMGLAGPQLTPAGPLETQMGTALSYTAGPLSAGEPLAFTLARQEATAPVGSTGTTSAPTRDTGRELFVGLLVLAAALVTVYGLLLSPAAAPPREVRPLVRAIARLDADFEAGRIVEGEYRRQREALKQQVRRTLSGR
jgi:hypothetical protein